MADNAQGMVEKRHWIRLTRVCNQRCLFCLDRSNQDGEFVPLESVKRELARGRAQGLRRVVLSGGEPTVHPRFLEIVAAARGLGYGHVQIITNGRRLCYPEFLDGAVAAGLDEITFSLHGHDAALHDRLTRVPGSFVQAVSALRRALATPRLIVSVDVVINRLNLSVLRELLEFYVALGVREFDLLALVPFGDAWKNRAELFCDFSQPGQQAALRRALELSRRPDLHLWTNRLKPEFLEGFEGLIQPPEKILDEVRGRRRIFARYLNGGRRPGCQGDSCAHCFLSELCRDLASLLREGRLEARRGPLCRPGDGHAPEFRFEGKPDVFAFAAFFIRWRHFAKGSRCRGCPDEGRCDGASVSAIRRDGFPAPLAAGRAP